MIDDEWNSNDAGIGGSGTLVKHEYDQFITSPSTAVVEAIASAENVDPIALSSPDGITLHDYVDTDALDKLFTARGANDVSITFAVTEYRVKLRSNEITIADR